MAEGEDTGANSLKCVCVHRSRDTTLHEGTKTHEEHEYAQLSDHTTKTLLQHRNVEVHQESDSRSCQPQVGDDLCDVNRMQRINRFQLEYDPCFDQQVDSVVSDQLPAIVDRQRSFHLKANAPRRQLDADGGGIYRFRHAGSKLAMPRDQRTDNALDKILEIGRKIRRQVQRWHRFASFVALGTFRDRSS